MSDTPQQKTGVSRRGFLKTSTMAAASLGATPVATTAAASHLSAIGYQTIANQITQAIPGTSMKHWVNLLNVLVTPADSKKNWKIEREYNGKHWIDARSALYQLKDQDAQIDDLEKLQALLTSEDASALGRTDILEFLNDYRHTTEAVAGPNVFHGEYTDYIGKPGFNITNRYDHDDYQVDEIIAHVKGLEGNQTLSGVVGDLLGKLRVERQNVLNLLQSASDRDLGNITGSSSENDLVEFAQKLLPDRDLKAIAKQVESARQARDMVFEGIYDHPAVKSLRDHGRGDADVYGSIHDLLDRGHNPFHVRKRIDYYLESQKGLMPEEITFDKTYFDPAMTMTSLEEYHTKGMLRLCEEAPKRARNHKFSSQGFSVIKCEDSSHPSIKQFLITPDRATLTKTLEDKLRWLVGEEVPMKDTADGNFIVSTANPTIIQSLDSLAANQAKVIKAIQL